MERAEAFHILNELYQDANEQQKQALRIAQQDIQFVDLIPMCLEDKENCPMCGQKLTQK